MDAMQILVIILSVLLALFLLLAIALLIMLIMITKRIRSVANSAERTIEKFEGVAGGLATATSARSLFKIGKSFVKGFQQHRKK